MMELIEAKSIAKSIFLQSASLSRLDVNERSVTELSNLVEEAYAKVDEERRPEAVSNLLRVIAATLEETQNVGQSSLGEDSNSRGKTKVCPIYPFD